MKKLFLIPILALALTVTFLSCKEKADKAKEAEVAVETEAVIEENFGGLALYTVRDAMGENAKETLKAVADAGYKNIEAAGYAEGKFYDMSPADFKAYLDEVGLTPISTHQGTVTLENADQMIGRCKSCRISIFCDSRSADGNVRVQYGGAHHEHERYRSRISGNIGHFGRKGQCRWPSITLSQS